MSVNFLSTLKSDVIKWFDEKTVQESDLKDFKVRAPRGPDSLLPFFEEGKNKSRAELLIDKSIYIRYLQYPAMVASWRVEIIEKFSSCYRQEDINKIFYEVVSEKEKRKNERYFEERDEEKGVMGFLARNQVCIAACSIGAVAIICVAIVGVFFFIYKIRLNKKIINMLATT